MQDQTTQNNNNPQNQTQDDFYNDFDKLNVSEDELKVMAAVTQAQMDSAESSAEIVKEMEELAEQEKSEE